MKKISDDLKAVWTLSRLHGLGAQKIKLLLETLKHPAQLFNEEVRSEWALRPEYGEKFVSEFRTLAESDEFEKDMDRCHQKGINLMGFSDPDYPKSLASIYDPPLLLYVKGTLVPEDEMAVAIVGTRYPSVYGFRMAAQFAFELGAAGVTIVSGLARGIDGEAHRNALRAKGRTIAVLGSGLDVIYPKEHAALYEQIAESGALISEYPFGTEALGFHFPERNRIIAGLSMGVLVVEASYKSGSLITASFGLDEGREVYAVPGPLDSVNSKGTNQLIQNGAKLVMAPQDILADFTPRIRALVGRTVEVVPAGSGTDGEDPILKLLAEEPLYLDEIEGRLDPKTAGLHLRLTQLELKGLVKRTLGGRYTRT